MRAVQRCSGIVNLHLRTTRYKVVFVSWWGYARPEESLCPEPLKGQAGQRSGKGLEANLCKKGGHSQGTVRAQTEIHAKIGDFCVNGRRSLFELRTERI